MANVTQLHDDLFAPADRAGIYWLRLYRLAKNRSVAVLTEVPGNPGTSVTNAASLLRLEVAEAFTINELELDVFIIWPRRQDLGAPIESATYSQAPGPSTPHWRTTSRKRIEALVGPLAPLPKHSVLFREVLARGGRKHQWGREIWEAVPVGYLPPFHAPYQCEHGARFKTILRDAEHHTREEELEAGRTFMESFTVAERAKCRYHQGDWRAIADASVKILAAVDASDPDAYVRAADATKLRVRDKRWLHSMFSNRIDLGAIRKAYVNGQHRGCALRFSGAEKAARSGSTSRR